MEILPILQPNCVAQCAAFGHSRLIGPQDQQPLRYNTSHARSCPRTYRTRRCGGTPPNSPVVEILECEPLEYIDTLIAVADDCPITTSQVPPDRKGKKTVANVHYELLSQHPGIYTQEDVLFESWLRRQADLESDQEDVARLREAFFAKPQACLRSSPLPKRYGWGLLFDSNGRISLCPMESNEYEEISSGMRPEIKVLKALRSSRR